MTRDRIRLWRVALGMAIGVAAMSVGCKKPDARYATPKGAMKTWMQAAYDGDTAQMHAHLIDAPGQQVMADGLCATMRAMRRVADAVHRKFGDVMDAQFGVIDMGHIDPKAVDDAKETVDGDHATLTKSDGTVFLRLLRVRDEWKIDALGLANSAGKLNFDDPNVRDMMLHVFAAMAKALDGLPDEIDAGKYPTFAAAFAEMQSRIKTALAAEQTRLLDEYKRSHPRPAP